MLLLLLLLCCRYYNAWLETYTEDEFRKHTESGTSLGDDRSSESLESEADQLDNLNPMSQEEESSSDDDDGSSSSDSELSNSDSDTFHSATEANLGDEEEEDSFVTFESSGVYNGRHLSPSVVFEGPDEGEEDSVFMQDFSDASNEEGEGSNVLGKLEHQVMRLSISKFRK